ncbi:MAG: ECF transporter S component [Candidatus Odinarchaeota archaeon]
MTIEKTSALKIEDLKINKTLELTITALLSALAIALRLFKHLILGPIQVINIPAAISIVTALILGGIAGASVGLISIIGSDLILGFGLWTIVTSLFLVAISILISTLRNKLADRTQLFSILIVILFINDVFTSTILYMILGFEFNTALITSIIGLFLPAGGGYMIAPGPITEISTSLLVVTIKPVIKKAILEVT